MRWDIRDFYDLKRQRVRRQRTERDDKPMVRGKYHTWHNNEVRFSGKICHTQFAGNCAVIYINVSVIFPSRDEGGFCNLRSRALFAQHSLF